MTFVVVASANAMEHESAAEAITFKGAAAAVMAAQKLTEQTPVDPSSVVKTGGSAADSMGTGGSTLSGNAVSAPRVGGPSVGSPGGLSMGGGVPVPVASSPDVSLNAPAASGCCSSFNIPNLKNKYNVSACGQGLNGYASSCWEHTKSCPGASWNACTSCLGTCCTPCTYSCGKCGSCIGTTYGFVKENPKETGWMCGSTVLLIPPATPLGCIAWGAYIRYRCDD